jgi:hypothetical protein
MRGGINRLLRNTPSLEVRAKLIRRLLRGLYKQGARHGMVQDFHTRSVGDPLEVVRIRDFLTAKENVPH